MKKDLVQQIFQKKVIFTTIVSMLLVIFVIEVQAAKPLSCTISPAKGTTAVGVPITFTGSTQGGKGSKAYSWVFPDGSPAVSTDSSVGVTYSTTDGTFDVFLNVTDNQGTTAICSATVTVTGGTIIVEPVGEALFEAKCIMCHGEFGGGGYAHRSIKGARASRIRNAMSKWPEMSFLTYLTDTDLADIEIYLDNVPRGEKLPSQGDTANGEVQFRKSCTYCHSFEGPPIDDPPQPPPQEGPSIEPLPQPGPDLMGISTELSDTSLGAWIDSPDKMVAAGAIDSASLANYPYIMPDLGHPPVEVWDMVDFLIEQESVGEVVDSDPVFDNDDYDNDLRFDTSKQVYFNRCAGCHGTKRTGATGPPIDPIRSQKIGTDGLGAILRYGTPAGMPNFGTSGLLTEAEIENLSAFLQVEPPTPPEWTMTDIQSTWNVIVPVDDRPKVEPADPKWKNYTGVILRDAGEVSIIDATTKQEVVRLDTGFAVHILRSSATGRYFYSVGRDGLVTLIDLWTDDNVPNDIPKTVATVKGCIDARSVDGSKHDGTASGGTNYKDMFVIEGCYWPPQYVTFDGMTLEPQNLLDLRTPAGPTGTMTDIYGATIPENRVAAIAAAHDKPFWMVALKESGYVAIVDYSIPGHGISQQFATEKFLHDGGFDHTGRYFMVAANASEKMVVVDLGTESVDPSYVTSFWTGAVPHPGRGANWEHSFYGWVNATQHLSEPKISVYGADPLGSRKDIAWTVVKEITLPSSGSLFIKTHPISPWVLFDMTMSSDSVLQKQICAIDKETLAIDRCIDVATNGKAVHMEFNADGSEVWVSDWANEGGVIILDTATLTVKATIYGADTPSGTFRTPTGKFNVTNTAHDIY